MTVGTYPVRVDATLDQPISRWLWLVKWLLAIPHYFVLFFLWIAFVVVSVIAFFAILFTGGYPAALFGFNVGVLRWSWRVAYYTYGALGTDRYPPFTLADVADYPARLEVEYPQHLSRGLVLVKWWLLAIPHYLVVASFVGGGTWSAWQVTDHNAGFASGGLIGLLVLVAAVVLLFTGRYPEQIFDFVLGMNRWSLRVAAYAGLMTDQYPPFRLDMGGHDPAGTVTVPSPAPEPPPSGRQATAPAQPPSPPTERPGWTGGRVVSLVIGSVLGLASLAVLGAGGVATWATNTQRDAAGYLSSGDHLLATGSYAITSGGIDLGTHADALTPSDILGTVRVRATATESASASPVFVGVAPQAAVDRYLTGVNHAVVTNWPSGETRDQLNGAAVPRTAPAAAGIWTAQVSGPGTQTLTWRPGSGQWRVVVMNADGSAGVSVTADAGATLPDLGLIAGVLLVVGAVLLTTAVLLIAVPVARASR